MIKTPKEKEEARKKLAEQHKKLFEFHRTNFIAVAATEEGLDLFRYIMSICNFQKYNITIDPQTGEVNRETSLYREARRSVYLDIRQYIPAKFLKKIEFK